MNRARRSSAEVDRWCSRFEEECRARGVRVTAQRLAVYRDLAGDLAHPTADAIHARLLPSMPSLSPATVYRILESLEGEGLVRRVSTTGGVGRFDANLERHHHYVCEECGLVRDFESEELNGLRIPDAVRRLGSVVDARVEVRGLCANHPGDGETAKGPRARKRTREAEERSGT